MEALPIESARTSHQPAQPGAAIGLGDLFQILLREEGQRFEGGLALPTPAVFRDARGESFRSSVGLPAHSSLESAPGRIQAPVTADAGERFEERDFPSIEFDTAPARVSDRGVDNPPSTSGPAAQTEDDTRPEAGAAKPERAARSVAAPEDAAEPSVDAEPEIAPLVGINQALSAAAPEVDSGLATAQAHGKGQLTAQALARMAAQAGSATAATPSATTPAGPDGGGVRVSVTPASLVAPSNAALGGGAAVAALAAAQAQTNRAGNTAQSAPAQGADTAPSAVQVLPAGLAAASQPVRSGSGLGNPDTAAADQTSQPRNAQTPNAPANNTQAQNTLAVAGGISEIRVTSTPGQVAQADTGLTNSGQANTVQANTGQAPAAQAEPAGPANSPVPPAGMATEEPATGAAPGTQGPTTPRNSALAQLATATGRPNDAPGGPSGDSPTLPEPKGQVDTSRSPSNPALNTQGQAAQGQAAQGQAAQGQAAPAQVAQSQQSGATGRTPVPGKASQGTGPAAPAAAGNSAAASGQPATAQPGLIPLGLTQAAARIPGVVPAHARPATPGAVPVDQVAVQIQKAVGAGQDRIRIQLHPAELGRIDVKLDLGNDGFVKAVVSVDKPETFELFQRDLRGLERALQDAGLKTDSGSLSFNLRGEDRGAPGSGQERGQPNDGTSRMDLDEETAVEPTVATAVSATDGRIDIRV